MTDPGAIDIFIPTCIADIEQASMLLQSLDTWVDLGAIASINVTAIDSPEAATLIRKLNAGKFQDRTRYLTLNDLGLGDVAGHGWLMQQAAKLAFARLSSAQHYMVLDSKNIALRPVHLSDLIRDGRAAWVVEDVRAHANWWIGSSWALSHKNFDMTPGRQVLSAATPVIFHTASVVEMLDWLQLRHKESIGSLFRNHFMHLERSVFKRLLFRARLMHPKEFTEFMMYYVFLDREGRSDSRHFVSPLLHELPSCIWASQPLPERAERLRRILQGETQGLFIGIQRGAFQEMTAQDRDALRQLAAGSVP